MNAITLFSALFLISCAAPIAVARQDGDTKDYDLEEGATVSVKGVSGSIKIHGWDQKTARVKGTKSGKDKDRVELKVTSTKKELDIAVRYPEEGRNLEASIDIEVWIPVALKSLHVNCVSGAVEIEDIRAAEAKASTVSGAIRVTKLKGDLGASSVSGAIRFSKVVGTRASLTATSGSIEGSAEVETLEMTTVNGEAAVDLVPTKDAWSVKASTINGAVRVRLPAAAGAKVKCTTLSGEIRCDFAMKDEKRQERQGPGHFLEGTFGSGTGSIRASTISGAVTISPAK